MTGLDIARVRPLLESEIERLIAMLDFIDDDPDFEIDDDDEPWLGATEPTWEGPYCGSSVKAAILNNLRPDLWEGAQSERSNETSQDSWGRHGSSDDREVEFDNEPEHESPSCYAGPCSPITTLVGQPS